MKNWLLGTQAAPVCAAGVSSLTPLADDYSLLTIRLLTRVPV